MRIAIIVLLLATACTKKNPEACCTDATDCMNIGLPDVTPCNDGLLCRGNRCVEVSCDVSAQCDLIAPYCVNELCAGQCNADGDCPGFGQTAADQFCVTGSCVQCREGMSDCDASAPVCSAGTCRRCENHDECPSGACTTDGMCVPESGVAYVSAAGSTSSSCTKADPCTLPRALALTPALVYVRLATGNHQLASTLSIEGKRILIGGGSIKPQLKNASNGPIIKLAFGADVTLDNLELTGAKNGQTPPATDAYGVECPVGQNATLRTNHTVFSQNAGVGIRGQNCTMEIRDTTFIANGRAISTTDTKATIERSLFTSNTQSALYLDGGLYTVTNNMIFRNGGGIELFANTSSVFEFNTIADNTNIGFYCQALGSELSLPNNLVARNGMDTEVYNCTLSNSIVGGMNIEPLKFKRPDSAPYDYHIQAGSSAIDIAAASTLTVDFDGEARPAGAANDVGADELH